MKGRRKQTTTGYGDFAKVNKSGPKTSVDRLLPGEEEELRKERGYKYVQEHSDTEDEETGEKSILCGFRMDKKRKEILQEYLRKEKDQNLSAGLRSIIVEYMERNNIL